MTWPVTSTSHCLSYLLQKDHMRIQWETGRWTVKKGEWLLSTWHNYELWEKHPEYKINSWGQNKEWCCPLNIFLSFFPGTEDLWTNSEWQRRLKQPVGGAWASLMLTTASLVLPMPAACILFKPQQRERWQSISAEQPFVIPAAAPFPVSTTEAKIIPITIRCLVMVMPLTWPQPGGHSLIVVASCREGSTQNTARSAGLCSPCCLSQ